MNKLIKKERRAGSADNLGAASGAGTGLLVSMNVSINECQYQ